jgi:hypothetical protein
MVGWRDGVGVAVYNGPIVSMVKRRSPKPLLQVRVLLGPQKKRVNEVSEPPRKRFGIV